MKLDKKKIVNTLGDNGLALIIGLAKIAVVTNFYSLDEAAVYFLLVALMTMLSDFKQGFLMNGFIKYLVQHNDEKKVVQSGFIISLSWDALNLIIFFIYVQVSEELQGYGLAYTVLLLTNAQMKFLDYVNRSRVNTKVLFQNSFFSSLMVVLLVPVILYFKLELGAFVIMIQTGLLVAHLMVRTNRVILLETMSGLKFDALIARKIGHYGLHGLLVAILIGLSTHLGIFLSAELLDMATVAIVGLAARYMVLLNVPGHSISGIIYPILLKEKARDLRQASVDAIGKMYALLIPVGMGIMVGTPFIILLLHGTTFSFTIFIVMTQAVIITTILPLSTCYTSVMNAIGKPQMVTKLLLITSVVSMATTAVVMYYFGIAYAIAAPLTSELFGFLVMKKLLKREANIHLIDFVHATIGYWRDWYSRMQHFKWVNNSAQFLTRN